MRSERQEVYISDICDSVSITHKLMQKHIILVNTSDAYDGKVLNHTPVLNENLRGQFKKRFQKDDILYSEIRPKNKRFAYVDFDADDYVASTKLMVLRYKPNKVEPKFLFHILKCDSMLDNLQLLAETRSGTFPQITFSELGSIKILLPSVPQQRAIAATLSCLDDKIELNNKINANLETQAQSIFKSWFVDFEPFQDGEFVDSEMGMIPKGWRVGTLAEIIVIYDSKRIPLSGRQREHMEKVYPYYGAASLMDYVDDYIFDGVYVLLGEDGTVITNDGYPVLQYVWGKFWVNNHAHILKGASGFSEESLFILLMNTSVISAVTGAVQPKISQQNLKSIKIIIPDEVSISRFNDVIAPIFDYRRKVLDENRTLAAIRDALLPKLMSGEIEVPLAE